MFSSKKSSKWNQSSSGFRGILKDLVKVVVVGVFLTTGFSIAAQATIQTNSQSQGRGISLGGGSSTSATASHHQTKLDSDYASVTQQSSITAGDQGYQINVADNTNLAGGLITSTDKAEASGNNAFSTGTLTQTDLANHAAYSGSSMGVEVGISSTTDSNGKSGLVFSNAMGQGSAGDSRHSTTQSGINTTNIAITDARIWGQIPS